MVNRLASVGSWKRNVMVCGSFMGVSSTIASPKFTLKFMGSVASSMTGLAVGPAGLVVMSSVRVLEFMVPSSMFATV